MKKILLSWHRGEFGAMQEIGSFGYDPKDPKEFARALKFVALTLETQEKDGGKYQIEIVDE